MFKNVDKWIGSYFAGQIKRVFAPDRFDGLTHVMFCVCDHYEPQWKGATKEEQQARVMRWVNEYPALAKKFKDADGFHPKHSFFYPGECYDKSHLDLLENIYKQNLGEVEIHLHHDNDTEETLREQLLKAKEDFARHGFLGKRKLSPDRRFAFIHGNWSLNNSRPDGKWCGVNDESRILSETGCYADFTFPSAPSATQPEKINSIYYASSCATKPKAHNKGVDVSVRKFGDHHLMMVTGPLTLNWKRRSKGIFPKIENGDMTGVNPPTPDRVDLWIEQRIAVKGKPDWIFVKTHTHGAQEGNMDVLLGEPMAAMHTYLRDRYNDGKKYCLHYVSAREMYNIIKAAQAGESGNPNDYRDYIIEKANCGQN